MPSCLVCLADSAQPAPTADAQFRRGIELHQRGEIEAAIQEYRAYRDAIGARLTWSAGSLKRSRLKNSGGTQRFTDLPIDRYITIVEGKSIVGS